MINCRPMMDVIAVLCFIYIFKYVDICYWNSWTRDFIIFLLFPVELRTILDFILKQSLPLSKLWFLTLQGIISIIM